LSKDIEKTIVSTSSWSLLGQFGYVIIGLSANIVLARILGPKIFGQIGIIMFFIIISKVISESGLSGALVRKNDVNEADYSTVFIFNLVVSIVLMLVIIMLAPYISDYYADVQLNQLLIVSSFILPIDAFRITQNAKLVHQMHFKRKAIYEFIAILLASIIGLTLAVNNFGVWSIVAMQLSTAFFLTSLLWLFEGPLRTYSFSRNSFKSLYAFGVNTTLASLLNTTFDNIYQLVLAKYFSFSIAGFFYQAKKIQGIPNNIFASLMHNPIYSSLSKLQSDNKEFTYYYEKITTLLTVLFGLLTLFVLVYSKNIINILYGENWLSSDFYLKILIVSSFFYTQELFNKVIFKIFNKTQKILYLEMFKKLIQIGPIIIGVFMLSIKVIMFGFLATSIVSSIINIYFSSNQIKTSATPIITRLFGIILSVFVSYLGVSVIIDLYEVSGYNTFFFLPLIISIYFLLLRILDIYNIVHFIRSFSNRYVS